MAAPLPYYGGLFVSIALGVVGQLLFKTGAERSASVVRQFLEPLTLAGFAVYALSAVCYVICLRRVPLSIAFPSVSLSYIAVALASHLLWQEPLGWSRLAGIALIALGVGLLNFSI